ncbi:hypothetical protein GEMRC1_006809 [Eukaryota sp. GEM-RC1]
MSVKYSHEELSSILEKHKRQPVAAVSVGPPLPHDYVPNRTLHPSSLPSVPNDSMSIEHAHSLNLPVTHNLTFSSFSHGVSSIEFMASVNRLFFYDINSCDSRFTSFSEQIPFTESRNFVTSSSSSQKLIAVAGNSDSPVLYDHESEHVSTFQRGDMYIADPTRTKGHTSAVKSIKFSPLNDDVILTSSTDGTCRLWKTAEVAFGCSSTFSVRSAGWKGGVVGFDSACFNRSGTAIAAATDDSKILFYDGSGRSTKINEILNISEYLPEGDSVCALDFTDVLNSSNSHFFAVRSQHCISLFDVRSLNKPVHTWNDLYHTHRFNQGSKMVFNSDCSTILANSSPHGHRLATLAFANLKNLEELYHLEVSKSNCCALVWDHSINQIIFGNDKGQLSFLFDADHSSHGALNILSRRPRVSTTDMELEGEIVDPEVWEEEEKKKRRTRRVDGPMAPPRKAQIGADGSVVQNYTARLMEEALDLKHGKLASLRDDDPREAILSKAKIAKEKPYFTAAYNQND